MAEEHPGPATPISLHPRLTPPHILHHLQSIRQQLIDAGTLDPVASSAGQLGSLLFRVEDLQAIHRMKVPWDILNDFSIGGGAHIVLSTILNFAKKQNWAEIAIQESSFADLLQELLHATESLRVHPKIYLSPTATSSSFEESIKKLRGHIVEFSQASHIVDTGHPALKATVQFRVVQKSGTHALLHVCKQPRSRRRWVPLKDVLSDAVDDADPIVTSNATEAIRVSQDWIALSVEFNEWLDENDFVLSDEDPSVIKLTRKNGTFAIQGVSGPIAKAATEGNALQSTKKRRSSTSGERPSHIPKKFRMGSPQISPTIGSDQNHAPHDDDTSMHAIPVISHRSKSQSIEDSLPYRDAVMVPVRPRPSGSDSQFPVVLPCYSTWFSFDSIHANERKSLHELFSSGDGAEPLYMQQRNFIVHAYRANPRVHLTATACRKMIAGDAVSLIRIHNFLEQWGIINYHVDPGTLPEYSGPGNPAFNSSQVYIHSPWAGVQKLEEFTQTDDGISGEWTNDENERLLLAILQHGENWASVAKAMGNSRTPTECLEQFVRIPLDRHRSHPDPDLVEVEGDDGGLRSDMLLPFQDSAHPILSQVALLASVSHPDAVVSALDAVNAKIAADSAMVTDEPLSEADLHVGLQVRVHPFGVGEIAQPIRADGMIFVRLPFGYLYTPVDNIMPLHEEIRIPTTTSGEVLHELAKSCMISAAMRSKEVSAVESRSILALVGELVETQMKKIEIKLKQFDEVQVVLSRQRELIEQARQEVFAERIELAHARMKLAHSQSVTTVSTPNPVDSSAVSPTNT